MYIYIYIYIYIYNYIHVHSKGCVQLANVTLHWCAETKLDRVVLKLLNKSTLRKFVKNFVCSTCMIFVSRCNKFIPSCYNLSDNIIEVTF